MLKHMTILITTGAIVAGASLLAAKTTDTKFGPSNPFYAPSELPFHAPPFDKIKDEDYQPAIEAGMAQEIVEIQAIAENPAPPTFENTLVAMEKTGQLLKRAYAAFGAASEANTDAALQKVRAEEAPKLAAHHDAIYLNAKLFARVSAVYNERETLKLDPESQRLLKVTYDEFVHSGANLSDADKTELKKLNEELSTLSNTFSTKLLAATKDGAYATTDKSALAGLSDAQLAGASRRRRAASWKASCCRCRIRRSSRTSRNSANEPRGKRSSKNPGTAPNWAMPTTRAIPSRIWRSYARGGRNCSASRTMRRGSCRTKWRKLPRPR